MKKQLITALSLEYTDSMYPETSEMIIRGIVFYMRRTRILKRKVRKIIHKVEIPLAYGSIEEIKQMVRQLLDEYVDQYYKSTDAAI